MPGRKVNTVSLVDLRGLAQPRASGIETHDVEGVTVRVYSPAKMVVDCFRYRNKIGLDVALKALRESRRSRKCIMDELWRYAKTGRIAKVIRPYQEAMA